MNVFFHSDGQNKKVFHQNNVFLIYCIINIVLCLGLPWRVMNFDASLENSIDSCVLLNVLKVLNYIFKLTIFILIKIFLVILLILNRNKFNINYTSKAVAPM